VTTRAAVAAAVVRLEAAGVPSARHDAEALAAHLLGVRRAALFLCGRPLDAAAYARLVERRAAREPLQHLVGTAAFRRLELRVGPGVFVPRPETEVVVDAALAAVAGHPAPLVVDLCAGSGVIAVSVATEHPGSAVHAVERHPDAVKWLRHNASELAPHVVVHQADVADPTVLGKLDGTVDLVVSNPPYVAEAELAEVDPEVRDHDPRVALVAGDDGLDVVRLVAAAAHRLLRPGGTVVVEHSDRQGESAPAVLRAAGFRDVTDHRDLAGRDRFVTAVAAPATP